MLYTTFRKAKEAEACASSYQKMAEELGGVQRYGLDTPIPLDKILEVCGLDDALWALRIVVEPVDREIRLFACDCAERVLPIFEKQFADNGRPRKTADAGRPRKTIEIARRFANGQATQAKLAATWATWDTGAAGAAALTLAGAAGMAALAAALVTNKTAWSAVAAAGTAALAAALAAGEAAMAAEKEWQKERFKLLVGCQVSSRGGV